MKSIKLIKAIGNISDSLIEEADDPLKNGNQEFQDAVEINVPKRKIRVFPILSFAAVLAVTLAAVFFAQTIILNKNALDINEILISYGEITSVDIVSKHIQNIDASKASEYFVDMKKNMADLFSAMYHDTSDTVPALSEQPDEEYVLFFDYSAGKRVRVVFCGDLYYIEAENETFGCRGESEEYKQLTALLDNYVYLLKNNLAITSELDGYKAEQVIEYMVFVLNVTFPDGETATVRTDLGDFGDFEQQIQISASPETEIFKLEHDGKTEYAVMQKVGFDRENKNVIFFGCDRENHELVRYDINYKNGERYMEFCTVSDAFMQGDEGNIFYDSRLEQKYRFDIETHKIDSTEYFSWEREAPEIVFSDIDEYFNVEKLNLDPQADIEGIIEGGLLYYYQREIVSEDSENRITGRIVEENLTTGEKRTIIEDTSENYTVYYPICVYNENLYFYMSGGDYYSSIWKINLNDYSAKLLCEASKYYEQFGQCGNYVVAENGLYFCDGLGANKKIYYLNFSNDSISIELDAAESLYRYKNGIVYSVGKDVFYRGDDDLYCVETLENGDKKLFTLDNPREYFYEYIYCSGEYLAVSKPYDTYSAWWHNGGTAIMLYDDKEGLKPLAKIDGRCLSGMDSDGCGGDEILKINGIFCDIKDNLFFDMPFSYEPPGYDYEIRYNYSDGKIYYMTYNYGSTDMEGILRRENAEFYCLTRK